MKSHEMPEVREMTEADYREMMQRSLKWNGGSWFVGKPITKKTFAAMYPNTAQTQSSNEAPEYEDDQYALSAINEKWLTEKVREAVREYQEETAKANKTEPESSKE